MPRIVLSLEEWRAVARELAAAHTIAAPPGLSERVRELLEQAHDGWDEQAMALELDEGSAETRPRRGAAVGFGRRGRRDHPRPPAPHIVPRIERPGGECDDRS
jgi:hypothetical protein